VVSVNTYMYSDAIHGLLVNKDKHRPWGGAMLLVGIALPQDSRAGWVLIREQPLYRGTSLIRKHQPP
jgi:hypothetical protein